ncbi:ATP-grasp fold amidoligase family protein [Ligilactobacillus ceti]|uniref:Uncharacterized protein n=1 Tax=Ligilactobacillus ceti DSM 22408 TaxID=1122146 RepID=A0A0R2KGC4_9LACO|nr:ATP-grasp fold amidoligase family protein [Ligilactobacillus ceti]KRN88441.1 hypothetical protein IV53_GL000405 [Ligilactobacillus ceti DSM 22408]
MKNKINKFFFDEKARMGYLTELGFYNKLSDQKYLKKKFKALMGYELDLDNPKTFNEKLQWLKLHDRKKIYTKMADKYAMRDFVAEKLGNGYTIPLLGVWDKPEDIDFDKLPTEFVLKCNHNSGKGMIICHDKNKLNINKVRDELNEGLNENYYLKNREWPYKHIPRKIICEQFMRDDSEENCLTDYKFYCFNGEPKLMYLSHDNAENPTTDFFDMSFNRLDIRMKDPNSDKIYSKPEAFEEMKRIAKILANGTKFLRVDFYYIDGIVYVGEMTFYHNAGYTEFANFEDDKTLGSWINIEN